MRVRAGGGGCDVEGVEGVGERADGLVPTEGAVMTKGKEKRTGKRPKSLLSGDGGDFRGVVHGELDGDVALELPKRKRDSGKL